MKNLWCHHIVKLILGSAIYSSAYADILFVCDDNADRCHIASQIASSFLHNPSLSRILQVNSNSIDSNAQKVLLEWNIGAVYQPVALTEGDIVSARQVLVMTSKQLKVLKSAYPKYQHKIQLLSTCAGYPGIDVLVPLDSSLKSYQALRDQIYAYEQVIAANRWECVRSVQTTIQNDLK